MTSCAGLLVWPFRRRNRFARNLRACLGLLILLLSSAGALLGLDPGKHIDQYGHDFWTSQQGLPGEAVYQILQTPDGYLWMRTSEGLVRFDGVRFVAMDTVFGGGAVRAIASSAEGDLLIRTNGRTLAYKNGAFSDYLPARPLPDGDIKTLLESSKHEVFIGSDDFIYLNRKYGIRMLLQGTGHVDAMAEDDKGKVWFGGAYALYSYLDGVLSTAIDAKTMKRYGATSALVSDHRNLWLGTSTGLYRMANDSQALVQVAPAAIHGRLHAILEDHQGNRWIGSERGLLRLTGDQVSSFTVADGLTDNTVLSLFEDREGSLWVGTASGLDRFRNT